VKSHLGAVRSLISASVKASAISREGRARNITRRPNITAEISIGTLFRGYTAILTDEWVYTPLHTIHPCYYSLALLWSNYYI